MTKYKAALMAEVEAKVNELEKKVELLAKAVSMMMLEGEELSEDEIKEIRSRLSDWLRGKRGEFVDLDFEYYPYFSTRSLRNPSQAPFSFFHV